MGACSISSLRTFCICRDRRFVTIPANIKNLITNCAINRLMSILFSFQSRNFIKLNKSRHQLLRCQISDDIVVCFSFLTDYRLKRSLYVKLKDRKSNSVDPDETAHMSRLIWVYAVCKSLLLSPVAVKIKESHYRSILPVTLKIC